MKILVCTDGSELSMKAAEKAAEIAGGCRVDEIALVHVYPYYVYSGGIYPAPQLSSQPLGDTNQTEEKKDGERILAKAAQAFPDTGHGVKKILLSGHPAEEILKLAKTENYTLIIIANRGLGGLKKTLLGSVSNAVLQETGASVMIVK